MPFLNKLKQYIRRTRHRESEPASAYDIWALSYDNQPDNLMLALDEQLCTELLGGALVSGKVVVDIGCGTGRHWKKLYDKGPARLVGYDVSEGMLNRLREKYPQAETYLMKDQQLTHLEAGCCDLVLSTLTMAHIPDIRSAFREWIRLLKPGGELILTDYHPAALARGGQRTFREGKRVIAIRNHIYPIAKIRRICRQLGLLELRVMERMIDDTMRHYYEKQGAMPIFERFRGVPIIYGLHLIKSNEAE
jgi:ubiquinone/menaquinone biosynthesis C-methylase UbiE